MSSGFGVVVLPKDIYLYLIDSRNIHPSIVQDHPLRIGGERLEVRRIFVASRQGKVSYLSKVGTDFGILIEGRNDAVGASVPRCNRSTIDCVEEIGDKDGVFQIEEGRIYLLWLQEGHGTFNRVVAKGVIEASGRGLWFPTLFAGSENNPKIESREFLHPPGLSSIVYLGLREPQQVLVIGEYNHLLAQSFEIMMVLVHRLDDCQHLLIVDFIIEFR